MYHSQRVAIGRAAVALVIVLLIVVSGVSLYVGMSISRSTSTTVSTVVSTVSLSSSSTVSSSSSSTVSSSSSSTVSSSTSSSSTVAVPSTLAIDDALWPASDLSEVNPAHGLGNYPNWGQGTVYQYLADINASKENLQGVVQYLPDLASNWTTSADGDTYTFNLRSGVTFSNGDPFNSYEAWVAFYTEYYLSANSSAFLASFNFWYKDMSTVNFGPATYQLLNQSGLATPSAAALSIMTNSSWPIYTTGPEQINFHLGNPISFFPGLMMDINMVDMQWVMDHGGVGTPVAPNPYLNSHAQPGTGPYMITSYSEGSWIKFTQNPTYWGRNLTQAQIAANPMLDPGHVKNVIIYYKSDDVARYVDVATGEAQISAIESGDWRSVTNSPATFSYLTLPPSSIMFFGISLNTNLYPTNITDVRQAIVHAINYTYFIQEVFQGHATQFVGPEEPLFKQFYDLGNYSVYSYNTTLAEQDLAAANIKSMPTVTIITISGCDFCSVAAQVIQADLTQIGIPTNIEILSESAYWSPYGNYQTNVQDAAQLGQISFTGGETWAGDVVPASNWVFMVSNESVWGNWAGYYNPKVQTCVNDFTNGTPSGELLSVCTAAQGQIYNDAPYVWFTPQLWWIDGSIVWLKNGPVQSFYVDPLDTAWNTAPLFNTVKFK